MQRRVSTGMVVTIHKLLEETSVSTYAIRQRLQLYQLKKTWDALSEFIVQSLLRQKGVLIPSLGTFLVLTKTRRGQRELSPAFELLDGRFSTVSQEISRLDRFSKKEAVLNISYQYLSKEVSLHRSSCQKLVKNTMERLAMHIISGNNIQIAFPRVGTLLRNKAGRLQFRFEKYFVEQMNASACRTGSAISSIHNTSRPTVKPVRQSVPLLDSNAAARGRKEEQKQLPPCEDSSGIAICSELDKIWKLCKKADRVNAGSVTRREFERWIQQHCRHLLRQIDALSLIDLFQTHSRDKNGSLLLYPSFLISLKETVQERDCQVMKLDNKYDPKEEESVSGSASEDPTVSDAENEVLSEAESLLVGTDNDSEVQGDQDQGHRDQCSRRECDRFNAQHFRRLLKSRGSDVAPKVGEEPLTLEETHIARARTAPEQTITTAPPPFEAPTSQSKDTPQPVTILKDSWQCQIEEKAKQKEMLRSTEEKWPYGPTHQPHNRIAAAAPRYVHAHYVRPYDAPQHFPTYLTNGCSYWSGL